MQTITLKHHRTGDTRNAREGFAVEFLILGPLWFFRDSAKLAIGGMISYAVLAWVVNYLLTEPLFGPDKATYVSIILLNVMLAFFGNTIARRHWESLGFRPE